MPVIRKKLAPSDVYPDDIRYNPSGDQVEVLIDGVWTPAPGSDPRHQTTLPPRITADTKCDAAASIADALENQIAQIITAIDNSLTLFQIAGLILGLFSFGVFAIFIELALLVADYLFGLGSTAILAALPPAAYDTLKCILYCYMDSNGRIAAGDLPNIYQDCVDQIGATGGQILIEMMQLAGEGGLNNLASLGTATGDCSTCGCATTWCKYWDFSASAGNWEAIAVGTGGIFGTFVPGEWQATDAVETVSSPDLAHRGIALRCILATRTVTHVVVTFNLTKGTYDVNGSALRFTNGDIFTGTVIRNTLSSVLVDGTGLTMDWTGVQVAEMFEFWLFSSRDQSVPYAYSGSCAITSILMEGEGENPFGPDDCP